MCHREARAALPITELRKRKGKRPEMMQPRASLAHMPLCMQPQCVRIRAVRPGWSKWAGSGYAGMDATGCVMMMRRVTCECPLLYWRYAPSHLS